MTLDLTYTDANGVEQGVLVSYDLDLAYGSDENDFELVLPPGVDLSRGALVYVAGTEWGGVVRGRRESTLSGKRTCASTGRTWHGMLAEAYLPPDEGASRLTVSGEANAVLSGLVDRLGLGAVFDVAEKDSGVTVSCEFEAFEEAYGGIRRMLAAAGAKLCIVKHVGGKPLLSAVPRGEYVDDRSSSRYRFELSDDTPCNHLICLGEEEDGRPVAVHRYADESGSVSGVQTLFGTCERTCVHKVSSSRRDELAFEGDERLRELQSVSSIELALPDGESFDVGDVVGVNDDETGLSITAEVEKVIVGIKNGKAAVTNEIGDVRRKESR